MRAFLTVCAAVLAAWLGLSQPSSAVVERATAPIVGYAYDSSLYDQTANRAVSERGPPVALLRAELLSAIDRGSHGTRSCAEAATAHAYTTHEDHSPLAQVDAPPATTDGGVVAVGGHCSRFERAGVAANTESTLARTCLRSFAGDKLVLMADGTKKAIEYIEVGDRVVATDPETGERVNRKVTRVWVHDDTVLDLVVDGDVITTTEDHPFWSVTDHAFERADQLAAGEVVLGDAGRQLAVTGFTRGTERTALAYNLSIKVVHTYHVGADEILVHNDCDWTGNTPLPSGEKARVVGSRIWGHGTPAESRLDGLSPEELRGIAGHDDAVMLRNWYAAADEADTGGQTAGVRVQLAEKIVDAWYTP